VALRLFCQVVAFGDSSLSHSCLGSASRKSADCKPSDKIKLNAKAAARVG
jgi:hypothetical protein